MDITFSANEHGLAAHVGLEDLGISTLPSACRLFSRKAISMRGARRRVVQRVRQVHLAVLALDANFQAAGPARRRGSSRSRPRNTSSGAGDQASMSQLLTFRSARSPEQHSSWRTGMSIERNSSTLHFHILLVPVLLSSGLQNDDHLLLFKLVDAVNARAPRCRASPSPCGSRGSRTSASGEGLLSGRISPMKRPTIECSLVPMR